MSRRREDRSRWNNIRVGGITKISNGTWKSCKEEVIKIIKNKLDITDDNEKDRCHRMGNFQRSKSKPWTVVCKFLSFEDKHKVFQNAKKLKTTKIFIYEDFSKATMELTKYLWGKVLQYQQQNKIAYFNSQSIVAKENRNNKNELEHRNYKRLFEGIKKWEKKNYFLSLILNIKKPCNKAIVKARFNNQNVFPKKSY